MVGVGWAVGQAGRQAGRQANFKFNCNCNFNFNVPQVPHVLSLAAMRIAREEGTTTLLNTAPAPKSGLDPEFVQVLF